MHVIYSLLNLIKLKLLGDVTPQGETVKRNKKANLTLNILSLTAWKFPMKIQLW